MLGSRPPMSPCMSVPAPFQPVRVERIEEHHMHHEWLEVTQEVVDAVAACRARGGRVIAVGTTSVRSLETAAREGELPFSGDTDIFIYPGKTFHVVDALVTISICPNRRC